MHTMFGQYRNELHHINWSGTPLGPIGSLEVSTSFCRKPFDQLTLGRQTLTIFGQYGYNLFHFVPNELVALFLCVLCRIVIFTVNILHSQLIPLEASVSYATIWSITLESSYMNLEASFTFIRDVYSTGINHNLATIICL
jgi:hypothetical protein